MIGRDPGPWDQSAQQSWGISPDEAIFVTYSDHRGSKVRLIIFPSKALQFFVIAVPAICRASANSHVQTVLEGGISQMFLG